MMESVTSELNEINLKTADYYGFDAQCNQLIEECAELIQAVNKYRRAQGIGQKTSLREVDALHNLIEEMVDVEIMLDQLKYLLKLSDEEIRMVAEYKIRRTEKRRDEGRG